MQHVFPEQDSLPRKYDNHVDLYLQHTTPSKQVIIKMSTYQAPPLDSIAVSLFGWSKQIQFKSSPNSIRRQDPNTYSDTEMRALSTPVHCYHPDPDPE